MAIDPITGVVLISSLVSAFTQPTPQVPKDRVTAQEKFFAQKMKIARHLINKKNAANAMAKSIMGIMSGSPNVKMPFGNSGGTKFKQSWEELKKSVTTDNPFLNNVGMVRGMGLDSVYNKATTDAGKPAKKENSTKNSTKEDVYSEAIGADPINKFDENNIPIDYSSEIKYGEED